MHVDPVEQTPGGRVLFVADWTVDPGAVVAAAAAARRLEPGARVALVVPARLNGLDWAGDPRASCPCATRQLEAVVQAAALAEVGFELAVVGDPEPLAALVDVLFDWPASAVVVCERRGRRGAPFSLDLARRARSATGLPVERLSLPAADDSPGRRRRWLRGRRGHCALPSQGAQIALDRA